MVAPLPPCLESVLQWPTDVGTLHLQLCLLMLVSSLPIFIALLFLTAPYGRYTRSGWGWLINTRLAWMTQEIPSLLIPLAFCWSTGVETFTQHPFSLRTVITALFLTHYIYRSLIYPTRIKSSNTMPVSIWAMSFVFCVWNGFMQGYFLAFQLKPDHGITPRAAFGLAMQLFMFMNVVYADHTLITLRKPGETGYKIPYGGMFNFCSAGNYASEILEWIGYAVAGNSLAPIAFAAATFGNLAPRAIQHHQFYLQKFEDYPKKRKAVIPFIW